MVRADHLPRELHIKDGRIVQAPVRELDAVHGKRTFHENVTVQGETTLEGIKGRVADLTVTVQPGEYRSFTLKLAADADHHTSLTYDPYTSELTLDRSYAVPVPTSFTAAAASPQPERCAQAPHPAG